MGAGLKKNGTRAFVAVTAVCAALSPAALAAVGGVSAERRDATASRLVRAIPAPVVQASDGVLEAGAPGVAVEYRDAREPAMSWTVRRGVGDIEDGTPIAPGASFRIGSPTKTYLATAVLEAVGEGQLSLDGTLAHWLPGVLPRLERAGRLHDLGAVDGGRSAHDRRRRQHRRGATRRPLDPQGGRSRLLRVSGTGGRPARSEPGARRSVSSRRRSLPRPALRRPSPGP